MTLPASGGSYGYPAAMHSNSDSAIVGESIGITGAPLYGHGAGGKGDGDAAMGDSNAGYGRGGAGNGNTTSANGAAGQAGYLSITWLQPA